MKMKKIISLLLAVLMIASVLSFVSCSKEAGKGNDEDIDVVTAGEGGKENTNDVYDAEVKNLNGHEFWFLVRDTPSQHLNTNEVYAEEQNGDKVNDAVFKRNASLEKTYNCKIFEERISNPASSIREQLIAGEYQYDFIYDGIRQLYNLTGANLLADFNTLENIDLTKSWWDAGAVKGLTVDGKLFFVNGDAGTMDDRGTWILMFSKDLVKKNQTEDPYQMVKDGTWTVDKMYEIMQKCAADKDGDGQMTVGTDIMGYTGERFNAWVHAAACNATLCEFANGGAISIPPTINQKFLDAWAAIKPIITSPLHDVNDSGVPFRGGLCAFYGINAGMLLNTVTTVDFGVIPYPKLNAEQSEYYTTMSQVNCIFYAIPNTAELAEDAAANGFADGREQAAYFLHAFGYQSKSTLTVAFYEQVIKRQIVKDTDSQVMVELALKNKVYDPIVLYDFGNLGSILTTCAAPAQGNGAVGSAENWDNITSMYESRYEAARKALTNYINYINSDTNA